LTPAGVSEKAQVTRRFLALKLKEHAEIAFQIERLRQEVHSHNRTSPDRGSSD